jgi:uncharacterized protein (TIGR02757 family)
MKHSELKKYLYENYLSYKKAYSSEDPVWSLHKINDEKNKELTAFIFSCFAYGRVDIMNEFLNTLSARLNSNMYEFTVNFDEKKDKKYVANLYYRFNVSNDLVFLFKQLRQAISDYGSLRNLFLKGYSEDDDNILSGLYNFTDYLKKGIKSNSKFHYLIPDSRKNSTCKRLNLFLRWMVRKDEIDPGLWSSDISTSKLIMPVDTHVYRISHQLKIINRKSCDMKFAIELTQKLKEFDPKDPVKYDFALCHIGIDARMNSTQMNPPKRV